MGVKFGPADETASYADTLAARRAEYAEHVAEMTVSKEIAAWAAWMTKHYGRPDCKVWANVLPWVEALLVVRYGEAIHTNTVDPEGKLTQHWPDAFTADDLKRAVEWTQGQTPPSVTYLPKPE